MVVGPGSNHGTDLDISENGFLLGSYFVLACWVAIGATELVALGGASRVAGRAEALLGRIRVPQPRVWLGTAAVAVVAAVTLIPTISSHRTTASRDTKPFADAYAASVFSELPPRSVLFVLGQELTDPLINRQVVNHERNDVVVIATDGLSTAWYRDQISRSLGRPLPPLAGTPRADAAALIKALTGGRPVYMDPQTADYLKGLVGYRLVGLLNVPAAGTDFKSPSDPAAVEQRVLAAERSAGMPNPDWHVWPNDWLERATYSTAELEVARAYHDQHNQAGLRRALLNVLQIEPGNASAAQDLSLLSGSG